MRILPLLAAPALPAAAGASAGPDTATPPPGTGRSDGAVHPSSEAGPHVDAPWTIRVVPTPALVRRADRVTGGPARSRMAGAGCAAVTGLAGDADGLRHRHADRGGPTETVGFDDKGRLAPP